MNESQSARANELRSVVDRYFRALASKDFSAIPYADGVSLRAPLAPGGVNRPLVGKEALRREWWTPLEPALEGLKVRIADYYINASQTAIVVEAEITIGVLNPPATLRVADRFTVDSSGRIVEQENHFDPRDVTDPGWQAAAGA